MRIGIKKMVEVDLKTVSLYAKIRDEGHYTYTDVDGDIIHSEEGYVPGFFPGDNYGDYLDLVIDIETGQILNWEKPTREQLNYILNKED